MATPVTSRADLDTLLALNADYIRSVQTSDVRRFDEILADDFVCTNPDASFVDRAGFLKQTAVPVTIKGLTTHDVNVRLMGDVAFVAMMDEFGRSHAGQRATSAEFAAHAAKAAGRDLGPFFKYWLNEKLKTE